MSKKIEIFDPAMCCSTGVCGPSVNVELLRVATVINSLANKGIMITRFGLSSEPQAFVDNTIINQLLMEEGVEILPVTMLDGEVVKTKEYPSNMEFAQYLDIKAEELEKNDKPKSCCCSEGCC